jgi:hypothetical protein
VQIGVLECAADGCPRRNCLAVLGVTFHLAERQAERKRGVGIRAGPFNCESCVGDFGVGLLKRFVDLFFIGFSYVARRRPRLPVCRP